MDLFTPSIGLIIWQFVVFNLLIFLLSKFAWKPIINFINKREKEFQVSLNIINQSKKDLIDLNNKKIKIIENAILKKNYIIKDAINIKNKIELESKKIAEIEYNNIIKEAKKIILNKKLSLIKDLKNQLASISIHIAEKIIKKELKDKDQHILLIKDLLKKKLFN